MCNECERIGYHTVGCPNDDACMLCLCPQCGAELYEGEEAYYIRGRCYCLECGRQQDIDGLGTRAILAKEGLDECIYHRFGAAWSSRL